MNIEDFYEREHGYVFNKKQIQALITHIRNETIDECARICAKLGESTVETDEGSQFKFVYHFAMNAILEKKYDNLGN